MKLKTFLWILFYVTGCTLICFWLNDSSWIGIDDANIYFVYMRNLAAGHGFVFNLDGERVEGVTSLLWTLIGGVFFYFFEYPNIALLLLNIVLITIVFYKINLFFVRLSLHDCKADSYRWILLITLLPVIPGFFEWTVLSLLETGLWCFLLIIFSLMILELSSSTHRIRYYTIAGVLVFFMVLTRPESMVWVPFFIFFNASKEYVLNRKTKSIFFYNLSLLAVFVTSLVFLIIWRISYFGYPFPNTYYAKVSTSFTRNLFLGGKYIVGFLFYNPLFLIILVLNILFFIRLFMAEKLKFITQKKYFNFLFLFSLFLLALLVPLYTGGDYFANYRFMQPVIPLVLLSFFFTDYAQRVKLTGKHIISLAVAVFFSSYYNYNLLYKRESKLAHEFKVAKNERYHSSELNKLFSGCMRYPTQGVMAAGGCGFVYKGKTMDMLGLNYVKMAHADKSNDGVLMKNHAGFSKSVFFEEEPDLFWIAGDFSEPGDLLKVLEVSNFNKLIFKQIQDDSRFKKHYVNCLISRIGYDKILRIFAKRSFLDQLDKNVFTVQEVLCPFNR